jgi:UDP-N-acetylmuramate dehydrogenase
MDGRPDFRFPGVKILRDEPLARYTSARIGGPADWLVVVETIEELIGVVRAAEDQGLAWRIMGAGSNLLVADSGVRGLVVLNKARYVDFQDEGKAYAESGAKLSTLARSCISRGLGGLEWAVNVPGTVGGAVVGNAGAHGGDIAGVLNSATVLEPDGDVAEWSTEKFKYGYRDSVLKSTRGQNITVVLAATLVLSAVEPGELAARADSYLAHRKATQPPGASVGSVFKNPPGEYAGRLIESAGLKGRQVGGAQISPVHANFMVNAGGATAGDVKMLIDQACDQVLQHYGVELELEIELIGDWTE